MRPTAELRFFTRLAVREGEQRLYERVLQQKWVQHHIPAGMAEAPFEWRDVETVKEEK